MPYTTVGYTNGLGFHDLGTVTDGDAVYSEGIQGGRANLASVDTESSGFHQEALIPLDSETHAGEDISLHARGPGSQFVHGVVEQNVVFHLINQALDLLTSE
jgi:alkaline phosphatase